MTYGTPSRHPALGMRVVANEHPELLAALPVSYGAVDPKTQVRPKHSELGTNLLKVGATGSGKSTAAKLLMQSVLRPVDGRFGLNFRSLVFDAKTDLIPFLASIHLTTDRHVILTNPFDLRCVAWDIADDVRSYLDAVTFAEILVPQTQGEENPFWVAAIRDIVSATLHGLNQPDAGGKRRHWTFHQLIAVLDSSAELHEVLARTHPGRKALATYLDTPDPRLVGNVRASLNSRVAPHRLVAAAWKHSPQTFSMRAWAHGGGVLLVGNHYTHRATIERVNNLLLRFAINALLEQPGELMHPTTWLFLDELRQAGVFPDFNHLLTQGRSKGLRTLITAQGLSTLRAAFPKDQVEEIVANCTEKCVMQLGSPEDAEWAEKLFATVRRTKVGVHESDDPRTRNSYQFNEVIESKLEARAFFELASAQSTGRGLDAYYHSPGGVHSRTTTPGHIVRALFDGDEEALRRVPAFVPRPHEHFEPLGLSPSDRNQLGLSAPESPDERGNAFRVPPTA